MIISAGKNETFKFAHPIGVGLIESAINLTKLCLFDRPEFLIFIGSAGSYTKEYKIFDIIESFSASNVELSFLQNNSYTPIDNVISLQKSVIINSSNYISTNFNLTQKFLAFDIKLENMEFFSVLKVAQMFGINVKGIFIITNYTDENAHSDFIKNHDEAMSKLIKYLSQKYSISPNLSQFLNPKPLFYNEIDYTRMPKAYESIKNYFDFSKTKIIHIVGTNGKGTTGRFLAHYLYKLGFKTLHYASPHILKFNERIWINGSDVSDIELEKAHQKLLSILPKEFQNSLSYFEYTTLLAFLIANNMDFIVLEAGLGGEFDATNVIKSDLSLITTIDFDHQEFLGNTIKEIASTKLKSIDKVAIIGKQIHSEVLEIAKNLNKKYFDFREFFDNDDEFKEFINQKNFPLFLLDNLKLALLAIKFFDLKIDVNLLSDIKLFGRFYKIKENITIDVGHNPLSAIVIKDAIGDKKINLIYNSFKDKNYEEILKILKPIIKEVFIFPIQNPRIVQKEKLEEVLIKLNIKFCDFKSLNKDEEYLVYGSFSLIENFIKWLEAK